MSEAEAQERQTRRLESGEIISCFYWKVGSKENIGSRREQQDCMGAVEGTFRGKPALIVVLADGMGGMKDGAAFSSAAVGHYYDAFQKTLDTISYPPAILLSLAFGANKAANRIYDPEKPGGSTLISALFFDNVVYTLSIGDSRISLFRKTVRSRHYAPLQLNREHVLGSSLDERAWMGYISLQDAEQNMYRDALTSGIGPETIRRIDLQENPIRLLGGDKLALMSDGVYRSLSAGELAESMELRPGEAADDVVRRICEKNIPKQDNMSILIVERV